MIGLTRRTRTTFDDVDPDRLHVFVPGILGAGILVSIGLLFADAARKIGGGRGQRRQVQIAAHHLAHDVIGRGDLESARRDHTGMRKRGTYLVSAALFIGLGIYGVLGSTFNFLGVTRWSENVAWIWAGLLVIVASFLFLGFILLGTALRWNRIPAAARAVVVRSPLGKAPRHDHGSGRGRLPS